MANQPLLDIESPEYFSRIADLVRNISLMPVRSARWIRAPEHAGGWTAVLPGTFNPPTNAHLALAKEAMAAGADALVYVVAVQSVDKEQLTAMRLEDRLMLLDQIASRTGASVAVSNRGLYVDIARSMRELLPASRLSFVIGFDKLVQILDSRYYDDRDSVLRDLVQLADLLVSPRGSGLEAEIGQVMSRPENLPFKNWVTVLRPSADLDITQSSSAIRARGTGLDAVPPEARTFIERWDPYGWQDDRYTRRWTG